MFNLLFHPDLFILQVLRGGENGENDPAGGVLLLLSDGKETKVKPQIDDVKDEMVEAGVIIDTVLFTQKSDEKLYELSDLTGMCACNLSGTCQINPIWNSVAIFEVFHSHKVK